MNVLAASDSWVSVIASLAAVPLAFVMLYLRSLREHQLTKHRELAHRVERLEESVAKWSATLGEVERDFTTKEEWLRETMHARHRLERLLEAVARLDAALYGCAGRESQRMGSCALNKAEGRCDDGRRDQSGTGGGRDGDQRATREGRR